MGSQKTRLHVAVIGAGPSGLAACHRLLENVDTFSFACYEQCEAVGGAWLYKNNSASIDIHSQSNNNHACIYDNLRTNLPLETMSYPDFPFTPKNCGTNSLPSYVMHHEVLNYLQAYCDHFHLKPHIRFNCRVASVELDVAAEQKNASPQFRVITTPLSAELNSVSNLSEIFDAVMICTGHYSRPSWPSNISTNFAAYKGLIMHSKFYRRADQFAECRKIVIMGGGPSGIDIAFDIEANSGDTALVLACHTNQTANKFHETIADTRVRLAPDIVKVIGPKSLEFADGSIEDDVDAIIMCTGYRYDFPFLAENLALNNDDQRLTPLHQHMLHMNYPNLCFIGLPMGLPVIPMWDLQVRYFIAMMKKQFLLPQREKMLELAEDEYRMRTQLGWPQRYAHKMGPLGEKYQTGLSNESGVEPVAKSVFDFFHFAMQLVAIDPVGYKTSNLVLDEESNVIRVQSNKIDRKH